MAITSVTVTGTVYETTGPGQTTIASSGTPVAGATVVFTPSATFSNGGASSTTVRVTCNNQGQFTATLAANDDPGTLPVGTYYTVAIYDSRTDYLLEEIQIRILASYAPGIALNAIPLYAPAVPLSFPSSAVIGTPTDAGTNPLLPSRAIEGLGLYAYGNSYLAVGTGVAQRRYFERLVARLSPSVAVNNGASGWLAGDCANFALGTVSMAIGRGTVLGTWNPAALVGGLAILEVVRNDAGWDGLGSTRAQAGFVNSLDALIRRIRTASVTQDTNAAFAYTGTWASNAAGSYPGGNAHYTSTHGDHVTITVPNVAANTSWYLNVLAFDTLVTGADFTVSVDGTDITSQLPVSTTAGQTKQGKFSIANWTPLSIPLGTLAGGTTHTVVLTHNGTTGTYLYLSQLGQLSPTPPTILIPKAVQLPSSGYTSYTGANASWATDQIYNGLIDSVVSRFGTLSEIGTGVNATSDRSIVTVDPNVLGWQTSMVSSQDSQQIHPGDHGMACYADSLMYALNLLGYRLGMNTI